MKPHAKLKQRSPATRPGIKREQNGVPAKPSSRKYLTGSGGVPAILLLSTLLLSGICPARAQKSFSFFAIGDMPYHNPEDTLKFRELTDAINAEKALFTVHVGDIKSGSSECSDAYFNMMLRLLNRFKQPLIYTPGDNEWTDCGRPAAGSYEPEERLAAVRRLFFANGQSLGQRPISLKSQHMTSGFEEFVENRMWHHERITFATLHVVGTNNNYNANRGNNAEFFRREKADLNWLTQIFQTAGERGDAAIVLFMHAAMLFEKTETSGFSNIVDKIREEVLAFGKPVLLIYGDSHRFLISKPLMDRQGKLIRNFTALMVYGDRDMNAVKVTVDPRSRSLFSFSEFLMKY